ncbi:MULTISPECIES: glycohydrolase toxin TNT-related protein [unclassified Saccharothrix]|uniref:glycohydrolase toxin TNT-related protein n=1 Tax=unclassified Saccharothrix TaxID=2593673 RepID=UPI00307EED13
MSEPKPLNPTEQDALVKQIGLTLMRAAPEDWRHVTAEYRATGRYFELAAEVRAADGALRAWQPPQEVAGLFARLRAGMYREGRGSWSNARYQLDHPSSYNLDFDRAEPAWQTPPPPQAYVDEVRFFPRTEENVPDWLRRRLTAAQQSAPPTPPGPVLPAQPGPPTPPGGQQAAAHEPHGFAPHEPAAHEPHGFGPHEPAAHDSFGTPHEPAAHEPHAFAGPHEQAAHEPHAFGGPHEQAAHEPHGFAGPHEPAAHEPHGFGGPHDAAAQETQLFPPPPHEAAHPEPPFAPPAHEPQPYEAPAGEAPEREAHHPGPSTPGAGLPAPVLTGPVPPRGFRTARVFDGAGPGGRPAVNRPPVPEGERELLLSYLDRAPVAVIGRGFDADVLNPDAPAVVPVAFQTDGHWIWPAAVGYYLRAYGVPPEPELVERAKANDYVLPEVPEDARVAAAANLGAPAAPRDTALPVAEAPEPFEAFAEPPHDEPVEVAETVAAPLPELPAEPEPPRADVEETANLTELRADRVEFSDSGPPYRVRFEEDGPVIDDRYRRESYVDGMDLFAPAKYDRDAEDVETTQAWNPFAEEGPEPEPAEETAEVEVVTDEPAAEEQVAEEPEFADEPQFTDEPKYVDEQKYGDEPEYAEDTQYSDPPEFADTAHFATEPEFTAKASADPEPEPEPEPVEAAEQTTEFDQFHEEPRFDQQAQFDQPPAFDQPAQFEQQAQFEQPAKFGEPDRFAEDERFTEEQPRFEDPEPPAQPAPVEPRQVTPEEEQQLSGVRRALDELDVPPAAYRFGEPVDRTWLLRTEGRDWEVSWFDHGPTNPVRFDRVEDAAAYLVGKLVLTGRRTPRPLPPPRPQPPRPPMNGEPFREEPHRAPVENFREEPHRPPVEPFREEPHRAPVENFREEPHRAPVEPPFREEHRPPLNGEPFRDDRPPMTNGFRGEEPPRRPAPPQPQESPKPAARQWPITPLNGEPPLTLFRHKKMVELPAGMEVDRFGDGSGNLVYVAGTPFEERSLVPSWINRPYRVYRLRRPVEVLTGVAVPWFEQPGGGTAYLLPKAVEDLIADGVLVEVANQEAPAH